MIFYPYDLLFLRATGENAFNQTSRRFSSDRFSSESLSVRVLIGDRLTGDFFDGRNFSANRESAYDFKHARSAIELIRDQNWFSTHIVLAYLDPGEDIWVSAKALGWN